MEIFGVKQHEAMIFLSATHGSLPDTPAAFRALVEHMRRHFQRAEKDRTWTGQVYEEPEEWHEPEDDGT
eukprot:3885208-Amphidinium_carterae.1